MFTTWDPILTCASNREQGEDYRTDAYHILKVDVYHLGPVQSPELQAERRKKTRELTRIIFWADVYRLKGLLQESYKI
jgi:hypothetical protein